MTDKTTMKYRVFTSHNPKTGGTLLRPIIVDRQTMNFRQLVAYARSAGFVRGQQMDLEGAIGGLLEAAKDRSLAGYAINFNNWFIISGRIRGPVDATRQLTDANSYHVTITATKDLKTDIGSFAWTHVDGGLTIRIDGLASPDGNAGEVTKSKAVVVSGRNLAFNAAWGDRVTVEWTDEEGEKQSAAITPSEQGANYLRFDWPAALAEVESGTELAFAFHLHGKADAAEQVLVKTAKLV